MFRQVKTEYYVIVGLLAILVIYNGLDWFPTTVGADTSKTSTSTIVEALETYEENYKSERGKYRSFTKQSIDWGKMRPLKKEEVLDGFELNEYTTPRGTGFCIRYADDQKIYNWGFGAEPSICGESLIITRPDSWIASST